MTGDYLGLSLSGLDGIAAQFGIATNQLTAVPFSAVGAADISWATPAAQTFVFYLDQFLDTLVNATAGYDTGHVTANYFFYGWLEVSVSNVVVPVNGSFLYGKRFYYPAFGSYISYPCWLLSSATGSNLFNQGGDPAVFKWIEFPVYAAAGAISANVSYCFNGVRVKPA